MPQDSAQDSVQDSAQGLASPQGEGDMPAEAVRPDAPLAASPLALHIVAGLHRGAEAAVARQGVVVGSGVEADVVLADAGVAPRHVRLRQDGVRVMAEILERPVFVDGVEVEADAVVLESGRILGLGEAGLAVGPVGYDWSALRVPVGAVAEEEERPTGETAETENMEEAGASAGPGVEDDAAVASGSRRPGFHIREDEASASPPSALRARLSWIAGGVVAVAALSWPVFAPSSESLRPAASGSAENSTRDVPVLSAVERVRNAVALHEAGRHLNVRSTDEGHVAVSGYIGTAHAFSDVRRDLERRNIDAALVTYRVTVTSSLTSAVRDELANRGFNVTVDDNGDGTLRVSGIVGDSDMLRRVLGELRHELPALRRIYNHVTTLDAVASILRGRLAAHELAVSVSVMEGSEGAPSALEAHGLVDEGGYRAWTTIAGEIRQAYGQVLRFRDFVEKASGFALALRSVVKGPRSFITLDNRGVYGVGASLPNGFVLTDIGQGQLLLQREGRSYTYILRNGDGYESESRHP